MGVAVGPGTDDPAGEDRANGHDDGSVMRTRPGPRPVLSVLLRVALFVVALAGYVGILVVRQGPPATGDTPPLTSVTTLLSKGQLHAAADVVSLPNPPGYALLTAPLVVLLRPWIGSATWCTTASRANALKQNVALRHVPDFA